MEGCEVSRAGKPGNAERRLPAQRPVQRIGLPSSGKSPVIERQSVHLRQVSPQRLRTSAPASPCNCPIAIRRVAAPPGRAFFPWNAPRRRQIRLTMPRAPYLRRSAPNYPARQHKVLALRQVLTRCKIVGSPREQQRLELPP